MDLVELICIKEASKLRIRILNDGFIKTANCQFPKNIRQEGRMYTVPKSDISIKKIGNKHFYHIKKDNIVIKENVPTDLKIYEDTENEECIICYMSNKEVVFSGCGHYICCNECACKISTKKCPMCRTDFTYILFRDEIG